VTAGAGKRRIHRGQRPILCSRQQGVPCLCSREHKCPLLVLPGTKTKQAVFVLPGAQESSICAPGSTSKGHVSTREHKQAVFVLPGAQASSMCTTSSICAPGNTRKGLK
jgi:hypothetical protein